MAPKESQDARARFMKNNPTFKKRIRMLCANEQQQLIEQAYEDEAERLGVGSWELTLQLIATSEEQAYQRILAAHMEIAEMVNMSWADYRRLHNLTG